MTALLCVIALVTLLGAFQSGWLAGLLMGVFLIGLFIVTT